ncbi:unnamed protein product [Rhizophagus irregularis]|nr:unnamed protein product [Rhizophagus irregularis]
MGFNICSFILENRTLYFLLHAQLVISIKDLIYDPTFLRCFRNFFGIFIKSGFELLRTAFLDFIDIFKIYLKPITVFRNINYTVIWLRLQKDAAQSCS